MSLTGAYIDELITSLWHSSLTPDQEAPEELRNLLSGATAEVAHRAKRGDLVTLLSRSGAANHTTCALLLNLYTSYIIIIDWYIMELSSCSASEQDLGIPAAD